MTVGERIKQKRIELGMSQEELAKKCGYKSRSSINKIELARNLPLWKAEQVADVLGVSPIYLMGWDDEIEEAAVACEESNREIAEISLQLRKSPILFELAQGFLKLSHAQQESVLNLIHSMIPDK